MSLVHLLALTVLDQAAHPVSREAGRGLGLGPPVSEGGGAQAGSAPARLRRPVQECRRCFPECKWTKLVVLTTWERLSTQLSSDFADYGGRACLFMSGGKKKKITKAERLKQLQEEEERRLKEEEKAVSKEDRKESEPQEIKVTENKKWHRVGLKDLERRNEELEELYLLEGCFPEAEKLKRDTRLLSQWNHYIQCDGSPDPSIAQEMNTFISLWKEETNETFEEVIEKSKLVLNSSAEEESEAIKGELEMKLFSETVSAAHLLLIEDAPQKPDLFEDNEVDLCQFTPLGGVYHLDILELPPQCKPVKGWMIVEILKEGLQKYKYPPETTEEYDPENVFPPIDVTLEVHENVIFFEDPMVVRWIIKVNIGELMASAMYLTTKKKDL
ncbi:PREDICTED: protein CASC1 [Propithecus coquereli]|uniref:protein CASC1 n=1 Tax=Propithecus coquereli TaxID=379532 RepID=UPI00063F8D22|nr:PREDICTED: protein CASC1 [Propithecus coquereli]